MSNARCCHSASGGVKQSLYAVRADRCRGSSRLPCRWTHCSRYVAPSCSRSLVVPNSAVIATESAAGSEAARPAAIEPGLAGDVTRPRCDLSSISPKFDRTNSSCGEPGGAPDRTVSMPRRPTPVCTSTVSTVSAVPINSGTTRSRTSQDCSVRSPPKCNPSGWRYWPRVMPLLTQAAPRSATICSIVSRRPATDGSSGVSGQAIECSSSYAALRSGSRSLRRQLRLRSTLCSF